ncbi:MAG TPA: hypothetical protein PK869_00440 [Candidatus Hydrogenedentes bacterium]|nr:hypothetical protein [Candidatus Hydrogenedentota bacterium]
MDGTPRRARGHHRADVQLYARAAEDHPGGHHRYHGGNQLIEGVPTITVAHIAGICWAAPNSIIGHCIGRFASARAKLPGGITEYHNNRILDRLGIAAIAFGNTINCATGVDPSSPWLRYDKTGNVTSLRAHECAHVSQYRHWGPFFLPAYLLCEAWARLLGNGINTFETAADDASTKTSRVD